MAEPTDIQQELELLADALLRHAAELRRECEELEALISPAPPQEQLERSSLSGKQAPIRSLAIEMALGGSTREEIHTHIRDVFGVEADPDVLDSVFERRAE